MYRLYYSPSTASMAAHWMLIELGVPFELVEIDFAKGMQRSPEYLAVNPSGRIPALVIDGKAHAEVAALLMLLAERHPEGGFDVPAGSPDRADYLQWMVWLTNTLQLSFRGWFYPDEPAGPENAEAAKRAAQGRVEDGLQRLDDLLADGRQYLVAGRMTSADFMATMLCRWSRNLPRPATQWPHLKPYLDRMRQRPGLREVHRREGMADWIDG